MASSVQVLLAAEAAVEAVSQLEAVEASLARAVASSELAELAEAYSELAVVSFEMVEAGVLWQLVCLGLAELPVATV